jgi:hypothetical protein
MDCAADMEEFNREHMKSKCPRRGFELMSSVLQKKSKALLSYLLGYLESRIQFAM